MKDRPIEEKPACAAQAASFPEEVTCLKCGLELEIWSDETEVQCRECGCIIGKK